MLLFLCILQVSVHAQALLKNKKQGIASNKNIVQRWELDSASKRGTFLLTSYKPFYITAGRWSSNPNQQPSSENPAYSSSTPIQYNNYEAKLQLSFKSKVLQSIFWGYGDLWVAYTQRAHWQIYNTEISRPFRELNYEPELILNFPLNIKVGGLMTRTIGVAFNHQSNGRELPLSRSWNRVMFHMSFENKHWQLTLRPWIRIKDEEDENPMITDYIGRGEATLVYDQGKHQFYLQATHSLAKSNRGSAQLNWVFPIRGNLRGQLQISEGYGETLIDYNHRQTTVGLGISFVDW